MLASVALKCFIQLISHSIGLKYRPNVFSKKNSRIVIVKRGKVRLIVASKSERSAFTNTNQETSQELLFSLGYPARQHSVEIETDTTSMSSFKTTLVNINDIARPKK